MTVVTPVEHAAEVICRRLQRTSPQRLPDLRRAVGQRHREHFIEAAALAIERGWVVREGREALALGEGFRQGSRKGVRGVLADQLDERLAQMCTCKGGCRPEEGEDYLNDHQPCRGGMHMTWGEDSGTYCGRCADQFRSSSS